MAKRPLDCLTGQMLSIGKVGSARGQQLYYEQQVALGREDYYAARGEAPGRWVGCAARELGLSGQLDVDQLTALMDGKASTHRRAAGSAVRPVEDRGDRHDVQRAQERERPVCHRR